MLSLCQVIGRAWSGKEGGDSGGKEPLRVFFLHQFHNLCTFSSWSLEQTTEWNPSEIGWEEGWGALYHSTIHNTTYLFLVKPPPLPPSKFHLLFFVWLLSRLVCKANLACHFKLISIQWRPLNLFLLFCSMRVGMSIQTSFIVCLQISASVQIWILVLMISFPKPMLPLELVLVCLCYRLVFTFLFNTELMPEL